MRKLWGGRFEEATEPLIELLNNSLPFDARLWPQDIQGSIAHATMLGATSIITLEESRQIIAGLESLRIDLEQQIITLPADAEDVHTAVEGLLRERIGPVAGKLHTARSRNDQVATDIRLYLKEACDHLDVEVKELQQTLLTLAEAELGTILPGTTHLQHGQPVLLSHHLLAYFWMLARDRERIADARSRIDRSPLGAGALAGTGFPIDRQQTAHLLGFSEVIPNSMDAVSDRDFSIELLSTCALLSMHLSRLAEEIIIWNSPEYGYVILDDKVTTGSSIMPQKKNPDVAELLRGKTGRVYGNLIAMLTVMKGLPLAYNKDMQEDKEPLFDTLDTLMLLLPAANLMMKTARFQREKMEAATRGDFSTATDLADYLVRCGMPFRDAHDVVGGVVQYCLSHKMSLDNLTEQDMQKITPELGERIPEALEAMTVSASVNSRTSEGGTALSAVQNQMGLASQFLQNH